MSTWDPGARDAEWERVTVRLPPGLKRRYDELVDAGVYPNLSEAVRDGLRVGRDEIDDDGDQQTCAFCGIPIAEQESLADHLLDCEDTP